MGYRHYLATIDKNKFKEINKLSQTELETKCKEIDEYWNKEDTNFYMPCYKVAELMENKYIYKLGKLFWDKEICEWLDKLNLLLPNIKLDEELDELYIITKENFQELINIYKNKTASYLKNLIDQDVKDIENIDKKYNYIQYELKDLAEDIINTQIEFENNEAPINSWLYLFDTFNLLWLYKTLDWDNNLVICYAW